jgi:hypothetical protein
MSPATETPVLTKDRCQVCQKRLLDFVNSIR